MFALLGEFLVVVTAFLAAAMVAWFVFLKKRKLSGVPVTQKAAPHPFVVADA
ncbi:hypothetical protein Q9Q94_14420 [Uliginosibacterium sp. 31-16]|uniref:hypothetical protein n=1 Tax=Uliginosibacterium sp. 31-16 TaxID=3068315 RepID=UPI00273E89D1|nr:hypothetical protein [Uliginosibacterium sp. 31-16]MDP5240737.1 hypothetical protein [Uliginosibacterium sp. 31-16]